jgi:OmpA-OmpF porin, OOP family
MRLRALFFALTALAGVAAGSWWLAEAATARVEREAGARARTTLAGAGETWARIETDGLRVVIAGTAPDEASRFRAAELIRQVVDPRRVEDATALAEAPPEPPAFALEILRTEREVSLIGLAPRGCRPRRDRRSPCRRRARRWRDRHARERGATRARGLAACARLRPAPAQ